MREEAKPERRVVTEEAGRKKKADNVNGKRGPRLVKNRVTRLMFEGRGLSEEKGKNW